MKIMVDLDRVVFDCPSFFYWIGNKIFNKTEVNDQKVTYNLINRDEAPNYLNLLFFIKMSHAKNYSQVDKSVEILKKWNKQGFEISFVSSRPNFKSLQKSTVEWLNKNGIECEDLIFRCRNKPLFCKVNNFDIIIDDTYENCLGSKNLGITPVWVRTKFNEDVTDFPKDMFNTTSWTEIDNYVQGIYNQKYNASLHETKLDVETTSSEFIPQAETFVDNCNM